jgi:small nuclear ribonucleoprotein B and B'
MPPGTPGIPPGMPPGTPGIPPGMPPGTPGIPPGMPGIPPGMPGTCGRPDRLPLAMFDISVGQYVCIAIVVNI